MKTRINVNQHTIRGNLKHGKKQHPIAVRTSRGVVYASEVKINGPCRIVYKPDKPLSCGARVWIETEAEVET